MSFFDADATSTTHIKITIPDSFSKQELWKTICELAMENSKLRAKLKKKKKPTKRSKGNE